VAEWDPSDASPHLSLAKLALQRHQQEEALKHLNQARVLAPLEYDVLYNLAAAYRLLGRTAEADRIQEALKRLRGNSSLSSTSRAPNSPWPRYAL